MLGTYTCEPMPLDRWFSSAGDGAGNPSSGARRNKVAAHQLFLEEVQQGQDQAREAADLRPRQQSVTMASCDQAGRGTSLHAGLATHPAEHPPPPHDQRVLLHRVPGSRRRGARLVGCPLPATGVCCQLGVRGAYKHCGLWVGRARSPNTRLAARRSPFKSKHGARQFPHWRIARGRNALTCNVEVLHSS